MKKWIYFAIGWLATGSVVWAAPEIEVLEPTFDFGSAYEGQRLMRTFELHNRGDEPLVIETVRKCSCLTYELTAETIPPGAHAVMSLVMDLTNMEGMVAKSAYIKTNDPVTQVAWIQFTGQVVRAITIDRPLLYFQMPRGEHTSVLHATLRSGDGQPFEVLEHELRAYEGDLFRYTLKTVEEGQEVLLQASCSTLETERERALLWMRTSHPHKPELVIPLVAARAQDVYVNPKKITFDAEETEAASFFIAVRGGAVKNFEITAVDLPDHEAQAQITQLPGGRGYRIRVSGMRVRQELDGAEVVLKTTIDVLPEIRIPIELQP